MIMLAYYTMNAHARTSGGRYLVPVDWVIIIYYFLGILTLIEIAGAFFHPDFFIPRISPTNLQSVVLLNRATWANILGVLFLFTMIGALIPLSGSFFERRYLPLTRMELVQQAVTQTGNLLSVPPVNLNIFLSTPHAVILQGRVLYPRQLDKDEGLDISIYNFYHPN